MAFSRSALRVLCLSTLAGLCSGQQLTLAELRRPLPGDSDLTKDFELGDVDGDGDLDLLIGNEDDSVRPTRMALNDGNGVFLDEPSQFVGEIARTNAIALGDVDGDGDLDALLGKADYFGGPTMEQNRLYINTGGGSFQYHVIKLPALIDHTQAVELHDLDADGDLDAVVGNYHGGMFGDRVLLNDGGGFFSHAAGNLSSGGTKKIAIGDVDGDGDPDLLFTKTTGEAVFLNDGAGAFGAAATPFSDGSAWTLEDVDGDGDPDAFSGESLYVNDGTGTFDDASGGLPAAGGLFLDVSMADVDGDGDLDALIGDYGGQSRIYLGDGGGGFADATAGFPANLDRTHTVDLADVDGDGDADALLGNDGQNRLYFGDGAGVFGDPLPPLPKAHGISIDDVDGDGVLDLFSVYFITIDLHLGDGAGEFSNASAGLPALPGSLDLFGVDLADVEGDGDLDAMLANNFQNHLLLNDGSGVFTLAAGALPVESNFSRAVALGDLDGDSRPDAIVANASTDPKRLYLNDGTGVFSDASGNLPDAFADYSQDVVLADFDADGDLDAMLANQSNHRHYVNDGSAVFTNGPSPPTSGGEDLDVADVDADGDVDVISSTRMFLNDGAGRFTQNPGFSSSGVVDATVAFGDFDGDGDPDVVHSGGGHPSFGMPNRLFLNVGGGSYVDASAGLSPIAVEWTKGIAAGDFDGDGDDDAVLGGFGPLQVESRIYFGLGRHVARRAPARLAKPLTMDVYGPPNEGWILAVSPTPASVEIPPLGTLRLDFSAAVVVGLGVLAADGQASPTYPAPSTSSLVGVTLHWQALVGSPLLFTNREETTLTDL